MRIMVDFLPVRQFISFITVMFHLGYLTVCATRAYGGNRALQLEHFLPSQGIILNFIISSRVAYTLRISAQLTLLQ